MCAYGVVYDLSHMHTHSALLHLHDCAATYLHAQQLHSMTTSQLSHNPLHQSTFLDGKIDATVLPSVANNRLKFGPNELPGSLLYVLLPTIVVKFRTRQAVLFRIEENVCVFCLWHWRIVTDL